MSLKAVFLDRLLAGSWKNPPKGRTVLWWSGASACEDSEEKTVGQQYRQEHLESSQNRTRQSSELDALVLSTKSPSYHCPNLIFTGWVGVEKRNKSNNRLFQTNPLIQNVSSNNMLSSSTKIKKHEASAEFSKYLKTLTTKTPKTSGGKHKTLQYRHFSVCLVHASFALVLIFFVLSTCMRTRKTHRGIHHLNNIMQLEVFTTSHTRNSSPQMRPGLHPLPHTLLSTGLISLSLCTGYSKPFTS